MLNEIGDPFSFFHGETFLSKAEVISSIDLLWSMKKKSLGTDRVGILVMKETSLHMWWNKYLFIDIMSSQALEQGK